GRNRARPRLPTVTSREEPAVAAAITETPAESGSPRRTTARSSKTAERARASAEPIVFEGRAVCAKERRISFKGARRSEAGSGTRTSWKPGTRVTGVSAVPFTVGVMLCGAAPGWSKGATRAASSRSPPEAAPKYTVVDEAAHE